MSKSNPKSGDERATVGGTTKIWKRQRERVPHSLPTI